MMDRTENIKNIQRIDVAGLRIVRYPDPRLREACGEAPPVDDALRALVDRMFELMFAARGVGLAAPQVGVAVRLFVASPSFQETDRRVYINPRLLALEGSQDGDEGCLSFPGIFSRVKRATTATIRATGLDGAVFEETGEDLTARIFQHEMDHIDGTLLVDRMGSLTKLSNRRALKTLEEEYSDK